MTETEATRAPDYLEMSADIVAAYVSNNSLPPTEIGKLLVGVHAAIKALTEGGSITSEEYKVVKATPAQIKKSVTPDGIISFEDGKSYKTMRRHLTVRGLTPEGYRAKHGLPADYPMVAPSYSVARSALARSFGLGQTRKGSGRAAEAEADTPDVAKPKRAVRPRKAVAAD